VKDPVFTSQGGNPTETLPAREVFHEIQTALRPLVTHVQTREQVDDLLQSLDRIRYDVPLTEMIITLLIAITDTKQASGHLVRPFTTPQSSGTRDAPGHNVSQVLRKADPLVEVARPLNGDGTTSSKRKISVSSLSRRKRGVAVLCATKRGTTAQPAHSDGCNGIAPNVMSQ
jgi:hypothetical protein